MSPVGGAPLCNLASLDIRLQPLPPGTTPAALSENKFTDFSDVRSYIYRERDIEKSRLSARI